MSEHRSSADYIDRTMEVVRIHRSSENSWPQWANILADEVEDLRADVDELADRATQAEQGWNNARTTNVELVRQAEAAEAEVARLREQLDAARAHSREASEMYVRANEQITELLQQQSFMERKLVAQREDIERLAERVMAAEANADPDYSPEYQDEYQRLWHKESARAEAAEARCARLQQALADVKDARRGIIAACIAVKGRLDQPYPDDDRWTPWTRFVEPALHRLDEALAGPDTPDSRVKADPAVFGESNRLLGTPADSQPDWSKCNCGAGPHGIHAQWCALVTTNIYVKFDPKEWVDVQAPRPKPTVEQLEGTLRSVLVQYERAMHELGWTMVDVRAKDTLALLVDRANQAEASRPSPETLARAMERVARADRCEAAEADAARLDSLLTQAQDECAALREELDEARLDARMAHKAAQLHSDGKVAAEAEAARLRKQGIWDDARAKAAESQVSLLQDGVRQGIRAIDALERQLNAAEARYAQLEQAAQPVVSVLSPWNTGNATVHVRVRDLLDLREALGTQ